MEDEVSDQINTEMIGLTAYMYATKVMEMKEPIRPRVSRKMLLQEISDYEKQTCALLSGILEGSFPK